MAELLNRPSETAIYDGPLKSYEEYLDHVEAYWRGHLSRGLSEEGVRIAMNLHRQYWQVSVTNYAEYVNGWKRRNGHKVARVRPQRKAVPQLRNTSPDMDRVPDRLPR